MTYGPRPFTPAELDAFALARETSITQPAIVECATGCTPGTRAARNHLRTLQRAMAGDAIDAMLAADLYRACLHLLDETCADIDRLLALYAARVAELAQQRSALRRSTEPFGHLDRARLMDPSATLPDTAAAYPRRGGGAQGGRVPDRVADARRAPFERAAARFDAEGDTYPNDK